MLCISCHFIPLKPLTVRMDHAKLLDVLTSLPVSHAILPRAMCFATSHLANHATCCFIDLMWICIWANQNMFIYRLYNNNYSLVSILPVLSKVLEKHVHDCLSGYLNENNLLHKTLGQVLGHSILVKLL